MIDKNKLKAKIVEKGYTQAQVAERIGISEVTFSRKINSGVFGTDEVEKMIGVLEIDNPVQIFFAGVVT